MSPCKTNMKNTLFVAARRACVLGACATKREPAAVYKNPAEMIRSWTQRGNSAPARGTESEIGDGQDRGPIQYQVRLNGKDATIESPVWGDEYCNHYAIYKDRPQRELIMPCRDDFNSCWFHSVSPDGKTIAISVKVSTKNYGVVFLRKDSSGKWRRYEDLPAKTYGGEFTLNPIGAGALSNAKLDSGTFTYVQAEKWIDSETIELIVSSMSDVHDGPYHDYRATYKLPPDGSYDLNKGSFAVIGKDPPRERD